MVFKIVLFNNFSTIRRGHSKQRKAPLAQWESSRVEDSPATEVPPYSFEFKQQQKNLKSPSKARRIAFWKNRAKSDDANNHSQKQGNFKIIYITVSLKHPQNQSNIMWPLLCTGEVDYIFSRKIHSYVISLSYDHLKTYLHKKFNLMP